MGGVIVCPQYELHVYKQMYISLVRTIRLSLYTILIEKYQRRTQWVYLKDNTVVFCTSRPAGSDVFDGFIQDLTGPLHMRNEAKCRERRAESGPGKEIAHLENYRVGDVAGNRWGGNDNELHDERGINLREQDASSALGGDRHVVNGRH